MPDSYLKAMREQNRTVVQKAFPGDEQYDSGGKLSLLDEITAFQPSIHGTVVDFILGEIQDEVWEAWGEGLTSRDVLKRYPPAVIADMIKNGIIAEGGIGRQQLIRSEQLQVVSLASPKRKEPFLHKLNPFRRDRE